MRARATRGERMIDSCSRRALPFALARVGHGPAFEGPARVGAVCASIMAAASATVNSLRDELADRLLVAARDLGHVDPRECRRPRAEPDVRAPLEQVGVAQLAVALLDAGRQI